MLLIRNPEAVSNKQAGYAVFINGLPVNTTTIRSLTLSEVEVESRGRGSRSGSGSSRGRRRASYRMRGHHGRNVEGRTCGDMHPRCLE